MDSIEQQLQLLHKELALRKKKSIEAEENKDEAGADGNEMIISSE